MLWEPFNVAVPSHRAVGSLETNCQCKNENLSCGGLACIFVCRRFERLNWAASFWSSQCIHTGLNIVTLTGIAAQFPISRRSSLRCCQYCGGVHCDVANITECSKHRCLQRITHILGLKCSLPYWQQLPIARKRRGQSCVHLWQFISKTAVQGSANL